MALSDIKARRVDILNVIRQLPNLSQKEAKATTKYIEKFFDQANDEGQDRSSS